MLYVRAKSKTSEEVNLPAYLTSSAFFSWISWYKEIATEADSGGPFVCHETEMRIPVQYGVMSVTVKIDQSSILTQYETVTKHYVVYYKSSPKCKSLQATSSIVN